MSILETGRQELSRSFEKTEEKALYKDLAAFKRMQHFSKSTADDSVIN